jgi:16S rRNA (cytidine1402-2'-O)-methyltransferase
LGILYIVPTPIGNLEDITLRALRILKEVTLIAAEDTRTSRVLMQHFDITTPMTSYHEHNKVSKLEQIYDALSVGDVALISDAGTPGISDPGYELVQGAIERGISVVPLPGANAVITALVASGLPTDSFLYVGFLPRKTSALKDSLAALSAHTGTIATYESPHRLTDTLAGIIDVMGGERRVCVARELTKKFEQFFRGTAQEAYDYFTAENPRGEVTLLIAGADPVDDTWTEARVKAALQRHIADGDSLSRAAKSVAKLSGWRKSDVYELGIMDES